MNLMFVRGRGSTATVTTPPLTGTLLPGVTRDAVLTLARDRGLRVEERPVAVEEWRSGCRDGSVTEVFACGTAALITPVGDVRRTGDSWRAGDGNPGPVTLGLRQRLVDIQHGLHPDAHGWLEAVPGAASL